MPLAAIILLLVTLQRLGELVLAHRNTKALLARGAFEVGRGHYPLMVFLHAAWLAGLWIYGWNAPVSIPLLVLFVFLQGLRLWVVSSLGDRWTTRIIILPDAPLVSHGPYRFMRHPNYAIVIGEIAVLPAALGLWTYPFIFTVANLLLLLLRISKENQQINRIS